MTSSMTDATPPTQVMVRWSLQMGLITLPKSVTPARIDQNIDVFDFKLSAEEVQAIKDLDTDLHFGWDPTNIA